MKIAYKEVEVRGQEVSVKIMHGCSGNRSKRRRLWSECRIVTVVVVLPETAVPPQDAVRFDFL